MFYDKTELEIFHLSSVTVDPTDEFESYKYIVTRYYPGIGPLKVSVCMSCLICVELDWARASKNKYTY